MIDADHINSADFEKTYQKEVHRLIEKPDWQSAIDKLEEKLTDFEIRYPIDQIRRQISPLCIASRKKHHLDRIIYIIPYMSIIDQNTTNVREILGGRVGIGTSFQFRA